MNKDIELEIDNGKEIDLKLDYQSIGGTDNYVDLENKPSINDIELVGNKTLEELGIQPKGDYALKEDIPAKTSNLQNDSGFITKDVADLVNYYDKEYINNLPSGEDIITLTSHGTSDNPLIFEPNKLYCIGSAISASDTIYFRSSKENEGFVHTLSVPCRGLLSITDAGAYSTFQLTIINGMYLTYTNIGNNSSGTVSINKKMISNLLDTSYSGNYGGNLNFLNLPTSSKTPTSNNQLVNKSYVDGAVPTKVSTLENDSNYQTLDEVNNLINNAIGIALEGSY